jgi:hypothetical protein
VRLVFTLVLFIFIGCVAVTLTSFREIPLEVLTMSDTKRKSIGGSQHYNKVGQRPLAGREEVQVPGEEPGYGSLDQAVVQVEAGTAEPGRSSSANPFRGEPTAAGQLAVTETTFSGGSPVPVDNWAEEDGAATVASFKTYLWSIVYMPSSLRSP